MTTAVFLKKSGAYCGFSLSGHSGFAKSGEDIVCSAVSSAVYLTLNNMIELYKADAVCKTGNGKIRVFVKDGSQDVHLAMEGLYNHLSQLAFQYPAYLRVLTATAKEK